MIKSGLRPTAQLRIATVLLRKTDRRDAPFAGGTGPESTVMYYKELNSKIDGATGGKNMPEVAIESVNFRKAWELVSKGQYKELADYLSEKVKILDDGGAEITQC